jgi:hypothetical protein
MQDNDFVDAIGGRNGIATTVCDLLRIFVALQNNGLI